MPERSTDAAGRRLVLTVGAVVFVDTMFFAVIAPLLPGLAHELRLSKLSAGVMTASYPFGMLVGSLPGGVLAARAGPRFTVCAGLALLACSTVAFGLLHNAAALDAARLFEGLAGACTWAGGVAWIIEETTPDRRGAMIGRALGAAIGGALFGPVVGTIASAAGRPVTFAAVGAVACGLLLYARALPSHHAASAQGMGSLTATLRRPGVGSGMWLMVVPAVTSGLVNTLGPLRLHRFGASALAIGATYLVATGVEAVISPVVGSISDRRGRLAPMRFGLAAVTATLLCFTLPTSVPLLAAVIVAVVASVGVFWAPSMAMLSDAAKQEGLHQGLAAALSNLAWSGGQIIGAGGSGAVAKVAGDGLPIALAAAVCAATGLALAASRWRVNRCPPRVDQLAPEVAQHHPSRPG